jgi:hypothetical protein
MNREEYIDKFGQVIRDQFVHYDEIIVPGGENIRDIYVYTIVVLSGDDYLEFRNISNMTNLEILYKWLSYISSGIGNIEKLLNKIIENVDSKDLLSYSKILATCRYYYGVCHIELFKIYRKLPNININEFLSNFLHVFNGSLENFKEYLIKENNNKISDLWCLYLDYSGNFTNYVDWLPKEMIEGVIMVENNGVYMPDYTTYIE